MAGSELRYFMQRSTVLSLYRSALQVTRNAPAHARAAIRDEARQHLAAAVAAARRDPTQEGFELAEAKKKIEMLREMCLLVR
jgi:hypothetical protein